MNESYWLFNTDETEAEGEGAYRDMLDLSVIAAWGHCRGTGARRTLDKPGEGETVFFFRAGHGIIASGEVSGRAFQANTIFNQPDEYHRTVKNLRLLPVPPDGCRDSREQQLRPTLPAYRLPTERRRRGSLHTGAFRERADCRKQDRTWRNSPMPTAVRCPSLAETLKDYDPDRAQPKSNASET
jgi:hypothetical protein